MSINTWQQICQPIPTPNHLLPTPHPLHCANVNNPIKTPTPPTSLDTPRLTRANQPTNYLFNFARLYPNLPNRLITTQTPTTCHLLTPKQHIPPSRMSH